MKRIHVRSILVLMLAFLTAFSVMTSCKPKGADLKIGTLFAVTGPASYLGSPEEKTAKMFVDQINAAGGIDGHQIVLVTKDTGAATDKALSFAKQLVEEEKVLAIIGPSTSGESMAIKNYCEENKTILLSCAAAETIVDPVAKHVFKTPQKDSFAAIKIFEVAKKLGIKKVGVVVSNDGFGLGGKAQLLKYAPDAGIEVAIAEEYDKAATDLTAVLTKLKEKKVEAVINWSIVPAQSIIPKNMKQLGMNIQLFQSHGFGNIKYVESAGEAAEGIIFPCGRLLIADSLPDSNLQKSLLVKYAKDYVANFSEAPSTFGGHAYDAIVLLAAAVKKAGSVDPEKVRDALVTLQGVVGTGGIFNMSATDHNGLAIDAFEMLTVKQGKFVQYQ
jgi:branched-chain amino acid transport system substrate-binding protein